MDVQQELLLGLIEQLQAAGIELSVSRTLMTPAPVEEPEADTTAARGGPEPARA